MSDDRINRIWQLFQKASLKEREEIIDKLSDDDVRELRYKTNPYRKPLYEPKKQFLEFSYVNLPRIYERNLMMTTMIGFMYKMASEWEIPTDGYPSEEQGDFAIALNDRYKDLYINNIEKHYAKSKDKSPEDYALWLRAKAVVAFKKKEKNVDELEKEAIKWCRENKVSYEAAYPIDVPPSEDEYERVRQELKKELGIEKTARDVVKENQERILDFLDYHFQFDPNNHIRCNYFPNYDKILQEKLKTNKYETNERGMIITENYEEYLVPPLDTFHSFTNYFETNYEHLRQCTDDIYGRSSFECAIVAREVFDTEKKAIEWENKYKSDFDLSIMRITLGGWTFIDPWKENRDTMRFDDEKTRLAMDIIEKKKEEERIGRDILHKRANKVKNRVGKRDLPFENQLKDYGTEKIGDFDMQTNVYQTKMVRSRRPKIAFNSSTIVLDTVEKK